jgi:hypothetical protein
VFPASLKSSAALSLDFDAGPGTFAVKYDEIPEVFGASFFAGLPFDLDVADEEDEDLALDGEESFFELELEPFFELELEKGFVDFDFFLEAEESLLEMYRPPPPPDSSSISISLLSFGIGLSGGVGLILRGDSITIGGGGGLISGRTDGKGIERKAGR